MALRLHFPKCFRSREGQMYIYIVLERDMYVCVCVYIYIIWERRHIYSVLVGKPEGKRPLGRHRHRWKENIKMNLKEMVW